MRTITLRDQQKRAQRGEAIVVYDTLEFAKHFLEVCAVEVQKVRQVDVGVFGSELREHVPEAVFGHELGEDLVQADSCAPDAT